MTTSSDQNHMSHTGLGSSSESVSVSVPMPGGETWTLSWRPHQGGQARSLTLATGRVPWTGWTLAGARL